ncbi:hypothetical protein CNR22_12945 [Sphingobacteriaceae bacterium]|nr:hypothetical protein CNR22_12945 [Sphingobacteriaceae bacterium]
MKKKLIASLFISSLIVYFSCQRGAQQFEISGRVLNYEDGKPLRTTVSVFGDDVLSAKEQTEGSVFFAKTDTHEDGTFSVIVSRYSRGMYALHMGSTVLERRSFNSDKKQNIGNYFSGKHTAYCKLTMHSVSDSSAQLAKTLAKNEFYTFAKGSTKQVLLSTTFTGNKFFADSFFVVNYTTFLPSGGDSVRYKLRLPISNLQDTLRATINY